MKKKKRTDVKAIANKVTPLVTQLGWTNKFLFSETTNLINERKID